ncbi:SRPBCC family protein [Paenibacillus cremeus]|uniref:Polyketide cyclase n=1 Tax=Paenibacillus cremeus TaxID=2163881 RepID=A0A559K5S5_9BACL|nr:SRPBCC family protein [Paenibacillus cremeus]TVY07447.1 polyketide cyclase [Paenibacillus cremeus]
METGNQTTITVETTVHAPVEQVWAYWTEPQHITQWSFASDDWHAPRAENDVRVGGAFLTRMEAKDGSFGFDFGGVYNEVKINELLVYTLGDGRKVTVSFSGRENGTQIVEVFEAEETHSIEQQKEGWQMFLNNFKKYCEQSK